MISSRKLAVLKLFIAAQSLVALGAYGQALLSQATEIAVAGKALSEIWRIAGLAGLAFVALAANVWLIYWLVSKLVSVTEKSIMSSEASTAAIRELVENMKERPCVYGPLAGQDKFDDGARRHQKPR